ncbi:hypothetical protein [Paraburkholderia sp. MM5477-R1]|uniref:hypothetical protein n=1 Tax=Paraburkholderia sp. MM5477-R1 TaxID=2991062 RepID=UPI003D1F39AD
MTAKRETIEYKCKQAAASSLFQCILERSGLTQTELEFRLGIEPADGSNYGRYLRGKQVPPWGRLLQIVRIAYRQGFLTQDDLCELGLANAATTSRNADDIKKDREAAVRLFVDGQRRILDGLLPMYTHGPSGQREFREPEDGSEMAGEYKRWVAEIQRLGGKVTWECYRRPPTAADLDLVGWEAEQAAKAAKADQQESEAGLAAAREFLDELELGKHDNLSLMIKATIHAALTRLLNGSAERDAAALEAARDEYFAVFDAAEAASLPPSPPLPLHHPDIVRHLNLWFGGREYSAHPYRLIHDDELTGNDSPQGIGGIEVFSIHRAACQRRAKMAEVQSAKMAKRAIARAARPDWRKSGAMTSNNRQHRTERSNRKPL